jgi:hypothetical protein
MNRIESTSRMIAVESGESEADWEKYRVAAIDGLRLIPLTADEMLVEVEPEWHAHGIKLLQSSAGRHEMLRVVDDARRERRSNS